MSRKLYLDDSYRREFEAVIIDSRSTAEGWEAILEETCFYPESGGQPADRGAIGAAPVIDVLLKGEDVVHLLSAEPPASPAKAAIDWDRRYDHMQQHTGQHLLTAAVIKLFDADTVGFHLGEAESTIDVALSGLGPDRARRIEERCSEWIAAAMPVTTEYVSLEEFAAMDLRKKALPDELSGPVRLVRIGDVDTAHCGGTHLRSTAELQMVKITGSEKVRDATRISFLAGRRAAEDYARKHALLRALAESLTCGVDDLPAAVAKLQNDARDSFRKLKKMRKEMISGMVGSELAGAEAIGKHLLLARRYPGWSAVELKMLAGGMTSSEPRLLVAAAGDEGDRGIIVLAAGGEFDGDMGEVARQLTAPFNGKGGGRGRFAQVAGEAARIDEALKAAEKILRAFGE